MHEASQLKSNLKFNNAKEHFDNKHNRKDLFGTIGFKEGDVLPRHYEWKDVPKHLKKSRSQKRKK